MTKGDSMNSLKKTLHILSWILIAIIKIVLALLGLVIVPIALLFENWPKLFWLWDNQEGIPQWWTNNAQNKWYTRYCHRWWWYAIRNPVNNSQFIFKDREAHIHTNWLADEPTKMEAPQMIIARQDMAYAWRWSGPFAGYRRVWLGEPSVTYESETEYSLHYATYSEIWFGWKVGSEVPGMGFIMQVRLNREIGT